MFLYHFIVDTGIDWIWSDAQNGTTIKIWAAAITLFELVFNEFAAVLIPQARTARLACGCIITIPMIVSYSGCIKVSHAHRIMKYQVFIQILFMQVQAAWAAIDPQPLPHKSHWLTHPRTWRKWLWRVCMCARAFPCVRTRRGQPSVSWPYPRH